MDSFNREGREARVKAILAASEKLNAQIKHKTIMRNAIDREIKELDKEVYELRKTLLIENPNC